MTPPNHLQTADAAPRTTQPLFVSLMLVAFFIGCTVFFVSIVVVSTQHAFHPLPEGSTAGALTDAKDQILNVKLDAYNKRAEELEKLTTFLIGMAVLYTLALGVASYFGLQQNLQQAKAIGDELNILREKAVKQLDEAESKATEVVHQIRDEFPLFGYVDTSLRRITKEFLEILPFQGWSDQIYANIMLEPQRIEKILFYEKTAASLEFFDLRSVGKEVSQIYDGLGDFYALKYLHEKSPTDLPRCKFYLERATLADPDNFGAWNDRAWVALVLESSSSFALARQFSDASLKINAHQQRALYNLSVCEHNDGNYAKADELLSKALGLEKWQEKPYSGRIHNLYHNRACARCRLAQNSELDSDSAAKLLGKALADFKHALEEKQLPYWDVEDWKSLAGDCLSKGDLGQLRNHYREVVDYHLRQTFSESAG